MTNRPLFLFYLVLVFVGCAKEYSCEDCIPKGPPEVETIQVTSVTLNSASFHGELLKTGGMQVNDFGFCWASAPQPTILGSKISQGSTDSLQNFQSTQNGFSPGGTYYVRAYAANDLDTVYGQELSFKTQIDPLTDCLVAYYPFSGNTNDESGNANHGLANGGSLTVDKNGDPGKAFLFDGDDYIKVLNSTSLSAIGNSFSITAWVHNEDLDAYVVCKSAYQGPDMQFRLYASGLGLHFANYLKAADFNNTLSPVNTWKHIAVTCDGVTAKYYLNGVMVSTSTMHDDASVSNHNTELYIGADPHNAIEFFRGKLDEIRIYCRVLGDAEVSQLYDL